MGSLRVALLGYGFIARAHHEVNRRLAAQGEPVELVAVCDRDERALSGLKDVRVYSCLERMMANEMIDYVDICLPTHLHEEAARDCLRAGLHVLCEKPMALNERQCDGMLREARRAGKQLMVAHPMRFFEPYRMLRRIVDERSFGEFRNAIFTRCDKRPERPGGWILRPEYSGGVIVDLQIHDIDAMQWLFGMPCRASATAHLMAGGNVLDAAATRFEYPDGRFVIAYAEWLPYENRHISRTGRVNFERGYVYFDLERGLCASVDAEGRERRFDATAHDFYEEEIRYFAECVRSGRPVDTCPPESSAMSVHLALCAQHSALIEYPVEIGTSPHIAQTAT